jgi:hypothetical protein
MHRGCRRRRAEWVKLYNSIAGTGEENVVASMGPTGSCFWAGTFIFPFTFGNPTWSVHCFPFLDETSSELKDTTTAISTL